MAKIYALKAGVSLIDEILLIAKKEKIKSATVEAIGTVSKLRLAHSNRGSKEYEEQSYDEQLEATSILGSITQKHGRPFVHIHGTFGRKDTSVIGGHVISATVSPLMEIVITPTQGGKTKKLKEEIRLDKGAH